MDKNTDSNTAPTASTAAQKSGLFGSSQPAEPATQPPTPPTPPTAKPKSSHLKKHPAPVAPATQPENSESPAVHTDIDFSDQQEVFVAIKSTGTDNPARFNLARKISLTVNRYIRSAAVAQARIDELLLAHEAQQPPAARAEPPEPVVALTVPELIDRLTVAIRDERATPTDVKTLTQVMQGLNPGMFSSVEGLPPDPCAIAETLTGWAGMTGDEIVRQMGGAESMSRHLSAAMKAEVKIILPNSGQI